MQPATTASAQDHPAALPATADLEVLLIRLGGRSFGVPLADVRYVAPMPVDFPCDGGDAAEHFVFEGSPLAYVPLWDRLGQKSAYAEYVDMQAMLPQRRQDHLDWMAALENSLRTGTSFTKARDPHECAFGKWFYAYRAKDRRLSLLLGQFEQPHAAIHALAGRLLAMVDAGQGGESLRAFDEAKNTTLAMLMRLFDSAQELVAELQRRIAVIVSDGADTCALGADGVQDIVTVPAAQVKHGMGHASAAGGQATAALLVLDERTVVPLLNWRMFCAGAGA